MLTLEQCQSLVDKICTSSTTKDEDICEECPIYNLFGRSGSCAYRLYDGQYRANVMLVLRKLVQKYGLD